MSANTSDWDDQALAVLRDMEKNGPAICDHAGHEWAPAGGGMLICAVCTAEKWEADRA